MQSSRSPSKGSRKVLNVGSLRASLVKSKAWSRLLCVVNHVTLGVSLSDPRVAVSRVLPMYLHALELQRRACITNNNEQLLMCATETPRPEMRSIFIFGTFLVAWPVKIRGSLIEYLCISVYKSQLETWTQVANVKTIHSLIVAPI